jgi:transcriptional repressor NrdR
MVCLYCSSRTRVANSRAQKRTNTIWRRRQCLDCGAVFTSIEEADLSRSLVVTNASKAFSAFQRDKLFLDVYEAVRHRKTAYADATALTGTIISRLLPQSAQGSVAAAQITDTVRQVLGAFDHAAATHYTAYHA